MTADAKIGLLLGLVFIFIIAFIINGLPSLWTHPNAANATPAVANANDAVGGVAARAQDVQRKADWQPLDTGGVTPLTVPNTTPAIDTSTSPAVAAKESAPAGQAASPAAQTALDESITKVAQKLTAEPAQPKAEALIDTTITAKEIPTVPAPAAAEKEKPALVVAAAKEKTSPAPAPTSTAKNETPKEYVVQDGDTLSTIAKKVYGTVGNNVQRIYDFNKKTLKSEDDVAVGQKLRLPPALPAATTPAPAKPADVLPASHFEKVTTVGKNNPNELKAGGASVTVKPAVLASGASETDGRWYVVRENDNLWKIATSQLGSGARFEEIAKLNGLKNKDNVPVGTRLKLPAK